MPARLEVSSANPTSGVDGSLPWSVGSEMVSCKDTVDVVGSEMQHPEPGRHPSYLASYSSGRRERWTEYLGRKRRSEKPDLRVCCRIQGDPIRLIKH
jgi:hypothetical protein